MVRIRPQHPLGCTCDECREWGKRAKVIDKMKLPLPCPSCASLRARIEDVEGMQTPLRMVLGRALFEHDTYLLNIARAVSRWLKEG